MSKLEEDYEKIRQLLRHNDKKNVILGLQLLKASMDAPLLAKFLSSPSWVSYMVSYQLVTLFQEHPDLWKEVKKIIPEHKTNNIEKWLPLTILELPKPTVAAFCKVANREVKKYFKGFPTLEPSILTERYNYGVGSTQSGNNVKDGIGWSLTIDERDIGPAEVIHEEEWIAIAQHPDFNIKVFHDCSNGDFPKTWLKKSPHNQKE